MTLGDKLLSLRCIAIYLLRDADDFPISSLPPIKGFISTFSFISRAFSLRIYRRITAYLITFGRNVYSGSRSFSVWSLLIIVWLYSMYIESRFVWATYSLHEDCNTMRHGWNQPAGGWNAQVILVAKHQLLLSINWTATGDGHVYSFLYGAPNVLNRIYFRGGIHYRETIKEHYLNLGPS